MFQKRSLVMALMCFFFFIFFFFTRVKNKQKNSIFNVPKRLLLVGKKIYLWPYKRLVAVNICQVERVCALQELLCLGCHHCILFLQMQFLLRVFCFILHLAVSTLCVMRSAVHHLFYSCVQLRADAVT